MNILDLITQYGIVQGAFIFLLYFFLKEYRNLVKQNKELFNIFITTLTKIQQENKEIKKDMKEIKEDNKEIKKTLGV